MVGRWKLIKNGLFSGKAMGGWFSPVNESPHPHQCGWLSIKSGGDNSSKKLSKITRGTWSST